MNDNWFEDLFINEAKSAIESREGGSGGDGTKVEKNEVPFFDTEGMAVPFTVAEHEGVLMGNLTLAVASPQYEKVRHGDNFRIIWDGAEYICKADVSEPGYIDITNLVVEEELPDMSENERANTFMFSFVDRGDPIGWELSVITFSTKAEHTMAVYWQKETVLAIESIKVVELETVLDQDIYGNAPLSDSDAEKLEALAVDRMPVVIMIRIKDTGLFTLMAHYIEMGEMGYAFVAVATDKQFNFMKMMGIWYLMVQ